MFTVQEFTVTALSAEYTFMRTVSFCNQNLDVALVMNLFFVLSLTEVDWIITEDRGYNEMNGKP